MKVNDILISKWGYGQTVERQSGTLYHVCVIRKTARRTASKAVTRQSGE